MNTINFTKKESEKIEGNLKAFLSNFENVFIEKCKVDKKFYIYESQEFYNTCMANNDPAYIHKCDNVDYLNGWLYGMVQCKYNVITKKVV